MILQFEQPIGYGQSGLAAKFCGDFVNINDNAQIGCSFFRNTGETGFANTVDTADGSICFCATTPCSIIPALITEIKHGFSSLIYSILYRVLVKSGVECGFALAVALDSTVFD